MTHDELLDRIAQEGLKPYGNVMNTNLVLALRAVVELHKPTDAASGLKGCSKCIYSVFDNGAYLLYEYPCPTIKVIEKELK